ncbi:TMEM175 family protein [Streptococcus mutans]|uniref:Ferrochelatase n=1 Tax=Streptococcus mutans SM6 TaxID=857119 RepID=A0A829BU06_STRMG|nr:TMEM175 family protein [Streptococcus mutans]EMB69036.1 hypothetical protein SMU29_02696 [Streptococcus mutans 2ST1]EMB69655.1 hypothetical protein SMU33_07522 [Streptococcus mutans 11SSST2]EMC23598.1 hypothetical protein SMU82_06574 [Streptococcus mutans SM6]EMC38035.1 hypothetical protein SMU93_00363 [Streptococcus mutans 21]MCB5049902.1 DUF1211 domain-containing protein [Streptococcus mutans]
MAKERLAAFTDAILAIIMTILVLELKKPNPISWENLWQLRMNFFAYTISFFWLGAMWVLLHRNWHDIKSISNKTVWQSLLMLFFSSFFPYATNLVASDFNNSAAQSFYGIIVIAISCSNLWMQSDLSHIKENQKAEAIQTFSVKKSRWLKLDMFLKTLGLFLSLTIWPSAMMYTVLFVSLAIVFPNSITEEKKAK